jgi:hypothetical protein
MEPGEGAFRNILRMFRFADGVPFARIHDQLRRADDAIRTKEADSGLF